MIRGGLGLQAAEGAVDAWFFWAQRFQRCGEAFFYGTGFSRRG